MVLPVRLALLPRLWGREREEGEEGGEEFPCLGKDDDWLCTKSREEQMEAASE